MTEHGGEQNGHVPGDGDQHPTEEGHQEQAPPAADLGLVKLRRLLEGPVDVTFPLTPGDRALVATGDRSTPGGTTMSVGWLVVMISPLTGSVAV